MSDPGPPHPQPPQPPPQTPANRLVVVPLAVELREAAASLMAIAHRLEDEANA